MKKLIIKFIYKMLIHKIFNPFLAMNIKPIKLEFEENDRCLVIAPHPDDESIGCGGIINLYPEKFDVLCLTHGDKDDVRYAEFGSAMEFSNVKNYSMCNFQDKHVMNFQQEFNKIELSSYNYIFIPYIFDQHNDHKAVSILLANKLKKCKNIKAKIAFYEVWSTINMPQYFVNISRVVDKKIKMINFHKSQIATKNYADKIIGLNSYRGLLKNIDAAEAFAILDVKDFLKVVSELTE